MVTFLLFSLQPRLLILEERALPGKAGGRAGSARSGCSPPRCCSASRPIFKADGCSRGDRHPLPPPPCTETLQANFSSPQSRAFSPPWILSPPRRPPLSAHVAAMCQPLGSARCPPAPPPSGPQRNERAGSRRRGSGVTVSRPQSPHVIAWHFFICSGT